MAVLKINSSVHDVIKRTLTWLDSAYNRWNLRRTHNIEKRPGDTRYEIRAQGRAKFFNFLLNLNITKESEKSTSVLIEAHLDKSSKLPVYILYFFAYSAQLFIGFSSATIKAGSPSKIILLTPYIIPALIITSILLIIFYGMSSNQVKLIKQSFHSFMSKYGYVEVVLPIKAESLSKNEITVLLMTQGLFWFLIILLLSGPLVFFALAVFVIISAPVALDLFAKNNPQTKWKLELAGIAEFWGILCLFYSFFFIIQIGFIIGNTFGYYQNIIQAFKINNIISFLRSTESSPQAIQEIIQFIVYTLANFSNTNPAIFKISLFVIIIVAPLTAVVFAFTLVLRASKKWWDNFGKRENLTNVFLSYNKSLSSRSEKIFKGYITVHYLAGSLFTVISFITAVDGLAFIFLNKSFLLKNFWMWLPEFYGLILKAPFNKISAQANILLLCIPFSAVGVLNIKRIILIAGREIGLLIKKCRNEVEGFVDKIQEVEEFINKVSIKTNTEKPLIMYSYKKKELVPYIKWSFALRKKVLTIPISALNTYENEEIKVVVAHELGHSKRILITLQLLKILCALSFFSNYYLTLATNFSDEELEADRFAITNTGNKEAFVSALLKSVNLHSEYSQTRGKIENRNKLFQNLRFSIEFLFGEGILGYSHPPLSVRLANIGV